MTDTSTEVTQTGDEAQAESQNQEQSQTPEQTLYPDTEKTEEQSEVQEAEPTPDSKTEESSDAPAEPEEFKFDVPETMNLDDATVAKLGETARELNLTAEQTQKLLDAVAPNLMEQHERTMKDMLDGWAKEVAGDKDVGGDKLEPNMAVAAKAVETFGDESLKDLLEADGMPLSKHPGMFRFLVKVGAAISEDRSVNPGINGKPEPKGITGDVFQNMGHAASVMYPNQQS